MKKKTMIKSLIAEVSDLGDKFVAERHKHLAMVEIAADQKLEIQRLEGVLHMATKAKEAHVQTVGEMAIAYDSQEQHYHAESARQAARINALIRKQEKIWKMFLDEQARGDLMRRRITRAIEAINGPHDNCSDLAKKAKMADGCYVSRALIAVEKALTS